MTIQKRKKLHNNFRDWYFSQEYGKVKNIKKSIIENCKIDKYKFNNWLNGYSSPSLFERKKINEIAGKNIF